ncbi:hypothetical protein SALBM311S_00773 [Streptomyces alboniger]
MITLCRSHEPPVNGPSLPQAYAVWLLWGRPRHTPATPAATQHGRPQGITGNHGGVAVFESVGALIGSPWIYAMVASSVLLDVFLPVLPSGVLVITAATAAAAGSARQPARYRTRCPTSWR